jgi:glycine/D-amino acid oxidase-like deaminating enzyme
MVDYLIVGSGLAGISFAETLLQNQKSFLVVDAPLTNSSRVAGGLYNPVVLKRFTVVWESEAQLEMLTPFYTSIEQRLGVQLDFKLSVLRKFTSIEEQNNWFVAADKPILSNYLSTTIHNTDYTGLDSPFHFGEVLQTGYVDVAKLVEHYQHYLIQHNYFLQKEFIHADLQINSHSISYQGIEAQHLVFAEGFAMHANPWFNQLPLDGVKGELLLIHAPDLKLDKIINSAVFILPLENGLFKVGATYNWSDKTATPTEEGKTELVLKLKEVLQCEFQVVNHFAGIRPTVKDRKPLLGTHETDSRLHLLNGLGTRGVLLGPYLAKLLFNHIEYASPLPKEIDLRRYTKKK